MITDLSFEYSPLWLVPVLTGAFTLIWILYFTDKSFSWPRKLVLGTIRFFILSIIGFLLISPLYKVSQRVNEKPILIWLEDHSSSLTSTTDSGQVKESFTASADKAIAALSEKYEVNRFNFSENISAYKKDAFNGTVTNISKALRESKQRFYNQNVGALVLLTDGIYNRGINPIYEGKSTVFPIYNLAFGDTTVYKDLLIEKLIHNELTYLNNKFPVEINVRARKLGGEKTSLVVRKASGKIVYSTILDLNREDFYQKVELSLSADSVGIQRYIVSLQALNGEVNTANNVQSFSLEIIDNRKQVHIIGSAPHPDISALASSLKSLEKYEVSTSISLDYDFTQKEPDLYILHEPDNKLLNKLQRSVKPYWLIYGKNVDPSSFTKFAGIRVGNHNSFEDTRAHTETNFSLFTLNPKLNDLVLKLPPLQAPFGKMKVTGNNIPLFHKKIGRVETTELLWFYREVETRRSAYIMASGIWQWRIYSFRKEQNFELFDGLVAQTVQYLTTKTEDQRFVVEAESQYDANADVIMNARLYNLSLELTNAPEVKLNIRSEKGEDYNFDFSKTSNSYRLNAGNLPPSNYTWMANTKLGEEEMTRRGSFSIQKNEVEQADLLARHNILRTISEETGGKFYTSNQLEQLTQGLLESTSAKSIQRLETNISSILNKKWIFFILLLLLATEWGLRKFFGKY